jgi:GWxTD domain-containing protein
MKHRILFIAFILTGFIGCQSYKSGFIQNYAFLYKKVYNPFRPELVIYHHSADSSKLFVRFNTSELAEENENGPDAISYLISFFIFPSLDQEKVLDSLSFQRFSSGKGKTVMHELPFKIEKGKYVMQVRITDLNAKKVYSYFINIDKSENQSRQYFLVRQDNIPLISEYITGNIPIRIEHNGRQEELFVKYFRRNFPIAEPPFAVDKPERFDYVTDSTFILKEGEEVVLRKIGFYHIQAERQTKEGITLYRFYEEFPNISSAIQMIEPVRYLTTRKEYDELIRSADQRSAIDKFWLKIGENTERSRELIRKYYGRVVEANKLFSSYKEGWKSDRGMIYIIYGAPNVVYKTTYSESWIYGEEGSLFSTSFTFIKVDNPFTDNDFILTRTPLYQNNWFSAIDTWRHGRAYNDN